MDTDRSNALLKAIDNHTSETRHRTAYERTIVIAAIAFAAAMTRPIVTLMESQHPGAVVFLCGIALFAFVVPVLVGFVIYGEHLRYEQSAVELMEHVRRYVRLEADADGRPSERELMTDCPRFHRPIEFKGLPATRQRTLAEMFFGSLGFPPNCEQVGDGYRWSCMIVLTCGWSVAFASAVCAWSKARGFSTSAVAFAAALASLLAGLWIALRLVRIGIKLDNRSHCTNADRESLLCVVLLQLTTAIAIIAFYLAC